MFYGKGHEDLSPALVYHPNLPQAQCSTQVLDSLDFQHIFHVERKVCEGFWTYEVRCVCKRVFDIDMEDRNLPQTASKQGYFYRKKTLQWKAKFKKQQTCSCFMYAFCASF